LRIDIGPLSDGKHNLTVYANDSASNIGIENIDFEIDTTPPVILDYGPRTDQNSTVITIYAITDEPSICRYNESNLTYEQMSAEMTGTGETHERTIIVPLGENTFYILCEDLLGNVMMNPAVISFNVTSIPMGGAPSIVIGGVEEDYTRGSVVTIFATLTDQNGNPVDPSYCNVTITHWNGSSLVYDLQDMQMIRVHKGFYYYNFHIPMNADLGSYGILVEADPSGVDTHAVSGFHVIWSAVCGNGICEKTESCENCPQDCGSCSFNVSVCGNGVCEVGETCENCEIDCGACPGGGGIAAGRLEMIESKVEEIRNETQEVRVIAERIWKIFRRTDQSVINREMVVSARMSRESSIDIKYTITVPEKEGYHHGEYLPLRWKFWFLDENGNCVDQEEGRVEPYCTPLIAQTIGRINDTIDIEIKLRPSLRRGNYSLVREFEVDPEETWISYGREIIAVIHVLEDNIMPEVRLSRINEMYEKESKHVTGMVVKEVGRRWEGSQLYYTILIILILTFSGFLSVLFFILHRVKGYESKQYAKKKSLLFDSDGYRRKGEKWYERV